MLGKNRLLNWVKFMAVLTGFYIVFYVDWMLGVALFGTIVLIRSYEFGRGKMILNKNQED